MNLAFTTDLARDYSSAPQVQRVLTESWLERNGYCPSCGRNIERYANNQPVADFFCSYCAEDFELKSKGSAFGMKIIDGAYSTMIERLQSAQNPNFFLLEHDGTSIQNLVIIPKHFFTPRIVEQRKPLSKSARRAGWVGCNINISHIPASGKIYYVAKEVVMPQKVVLEKWQKTVFLLEEKEQTAKKWLLDVMDCVDAIPSDSFSIADMYSFEQRLRKLHPDNRHVRDKIRQQLQKLRDYGYISFSSRGNYTKR